MVLQLVGLQALPRARGQGRLPLDLRVTEAPMLVQPRAGRDEAPGIKDLLKVLLDGMGRRAEVRGRVQRAGAAGGPPPVALQRQQLRRE
eukprot:6929024-Lingulodinium_polyedra.AAC.1